MINIDLNKFNDKNLKFDRYLGYIRYLENNNLLIGTAIHHVYPRKIFGDTDLIINCSQEDHTRLHLYLAIDNLDTARNSDLNSCLCISGISIRKLFNCKFYNEDNILLLDKIPDYVSLSMRAFSLLSNFTKSSIEYSNKMSIIMKKYYSDPVNRINNSNSIKTYWSNLSESEYRIRCSKINNYKTRFKYGNKNFLNFYNNMTEDEYIEWKGKISDSCKISNSTKEFKSKVSKNNKLLYNKICIKCGKIYKDVHKQKSRCDCDGKLNRI
jgi:hypothetical protein